MFSSLFSSPAEEALLMFLKQLLDAGTLSWCASHCRSCEGDKLLLTPVISIESAPEEQKKWNPPNSAGGAVVGGDTSFVPIFPFPFHLTNSLFLLFFFFYDVCFPL